MLEKLEIIFLFLLFKIRHLHTFASFSLKPFDLGSNILGILLQADYNTMCEEHQYCNSYSEISPQYDVTVGI